MNRLGLVVDLGNEFFGDADTESLAEAAGLEESNAAQNMTQRGSTLRGMKHGLVIGVLVVSCLIAALATVATAHPGLLGKSNHSSEASLRQATGDSAAATASILTGALTSAYEDTMTIDNSTAPAPAPANVSYLSIRVLGLFDSGTNLLCNALELNLWNAGCNTRTAHHQIWKHTVVTDVGQEADHVENFVIEQKRAGVLVVAMVRNPIAHMASLMKAPYDLARCFNASNWTQHALQGNCSFTARNSSIPWLQEYPKPGLAGVWNAQTKGYVELAKRHANMIVVKYEDLVLCPESTVKLIAEAANATNLLADAISIPEAPAKNHGNPNGREEAIKKIKGSLYLQEEEGAFLRNQLSELCPALDLAAAESDSSCSETPAYDVDCRGVL